MKQVTPPEQLFNFVQVTPEVATSGFVPAESFSLIFARGYSTVVNLLPAGHREALVAEREVVEAAGMSYRNVAVDFLAPTLDDLERFSAVMRELEGARVWVHCAANYRVTTFVALHARTHWGWDERRARELATRVWKPNAVWTSFYDEAVQRQPVDG